MKKKLSIFLIAILMTSSITTVSIAKPKKTKHNQQKQHSNSKISIDNNLMKRIFNIEDKEINYFKKFNIGTEELSLILYLYSLSNKTITANDIDFIVENKDNMARLTWYLGLPPIIFEDGIITLRHPKLDRSLPPLGQRVYQNRRKGPIKEKIDIDDNKYEYEYDNKPAKIKEKIEIKSDKYEYKYQNRRLGIEEKLEVKYPSYKYEYHYKNTRTGENIKKEGRGYPLNPKYFYQKLKDKKEEQSNFNVSIRININL
ncbi:hypothetical protein BX659_11286 [Orenia metallireducens]|jgi:hypothetical protein|uniref:YD repeat-containing protein n=1 Tax=Orenia metallireducens TaxID=1413210 RepID=A0A285H5J1_9FIRM|nr:lipase chaperone [Orenia metallireducens]PRX28658.1 hypothetical protein BX659_11286 [Orenia metallireducens]SNY31110.1 hypothetical protein SAMN06265827_11486 [Orenia metallireducens]